MTSPAILMLLGLAWIGGFVVLRIAAAKEVARELGTNGPSILFGTGWLRGAGSRARRMRKLALLWLIGGAALFVLVGFLLARIPR